MAKVRAGAEAALAADGVSEWSELGEHLREMATSVSALLNRSATPEEASQYRKWVQEIGTATAEAAREGGLLGFGGRDVSDAEADCLEILRQALSES